MAGTPLQVTTQGDHQEYKARYKIHFQNQNCGKQKKTNSTNSVQIQSLTRLEIYIYVEIHGLSSMNPWLTYPRGHYGPQGPCSQLRSAKDCWIGEEKGVQPCG